jgi:hypothetical protein
MLWMYRYLPLCPPLPLQSLPWCLPPLLLACPCPWTRGPLPSPDLTQSGLSRIRTCLNRIRIHRYLLLFWIRTLTAPPFRPRCCYLPSPPSPLPTSPPPGPCSAGPAATGGPPSQPFSPAFHPCPASPPPPPAHPGPSCPCTWTWTGPGPPPASGGRGLVGPGGQAGHHHLLPALRGQRRFSPLSPSPPGQQIPGAGLGGLGLDCCGGRPIPPSLPGCGGRGRPRHPHSLTSSGPRGACCFSSPAGDPQRPIHWPLCGPDGGRRGPHLPRGCGERGLLIF